MHNTAKMFLVKVLSICVVMVALVAVNVALADVGHGENLAHGVSAPIETTDRSAQLPAVVGGFVVGIIVGAIGTKVFSKKSE